MYKEKKVTAVIAAAGSSRRMGGINKQYALLDGEPVLARSVRAFDLHPLIDDIIIVTLADDVEACRGRIVQGRGFRHVSAVIAGGAERQDSVRNALAAVSSDTDIVLIHDGARPLVTCDVITRVIEMCAARGAAIPAVPVRDTIKYADISDGSEKVTATPDRGKLRAVQTPQGFDLKLLRRAYDSCSPDAFFTDDASLVEALGEEVYIVAGDDANIKITAPQDLRTAEQLLHTVPGSAPPPPPFAFVQRTGIGYDVHAFAENRRLILGGVDIPHQYGLLGHSDADVLVHAVMDALLGAAALGDIGIHFPDTDPQYKGASSLVLLARVAELLHENHWRIVNIDAVVIAQRPKISPYISLMKKNMAEVLKISESAINIKGTTTERLGFTGREEGIASQAAALITQFY